MQHKLKPISKAGVAEANSKAERYYLLNEPEEAESICRDVLAVEPENPPAARLPGGERPYWRSNLTHHPRNPPKVFEWSRG